MTLASMTDIFTDYQELVNDSKWFTKEIQPLASFKGHINSVEAVAFNPMQINEFVSGSHDKTIKRWDLTTNKCVDTIKEHAEGIWSLQYSNEGNVILSGSPDKTIMLYDLRKKKPINSLKEHKNKVYWAKFNETNTLIASGGEDHRMIIWDMRKQSPLKIIESDTRVIYSIEFSKDGKYLASSEFDGVLKMYDTNRFDLISSTPRMEEDRALTCNLDFSLNSKASNLIYVGYLDNKCRIWKFDPTKNILTKIDEIHPHLDSVKNISMLGQLGVFVTSSRDGTCRVWDCQSREFIANLMGHTNNIACSDIIKAEGGSGKIQVVTASWDQTLNLYKFDLFNL